MAPIFVWWDKAQHALGFAILYVLGSIAYPGWRLSGLLAGLLTFGIGIELAQYAVGWRFADIYDVLADATGLALAYLAMYPFKSKSGF